MSKTTSMTNLSPSAQAVMNAFLGDAEDTGLQMDDLRENVAAALRAVADQVVPDEPDPGESQFWDDEADREWQNNQHFRNQLLALADELKEDPLKANR